jgi:hypothetical protein
MRIFRFLFENSKLESFQIGVFKAAAQSSDFLSEDLRGLEKKYNKKVLSLCLAGKIKV